MRPVASKRAACTLDGKEKLGRCARMRRR